MPLFVQTAHSWLCRKASNDTHEYKFLAAILEDAGSVSPEWRPHLLAAWLGPRVAAVKEVAARRGEALVATAVGIFVAIPAVVGFNAYMKRLRTLTIRGEAIGHALASHLERDEVRAAARERIRQIERQALRQLRQPQFAHVLRDFLG